MVPIVSKIVIIEDDELFGKTFSELINSSDHYYVKAVYSCCEEAIENLLSDKPDIVLMDIDLPGMNGIQGTFKIKQQYSATEIVILTVHAGSEKVFNALSAGAIGYLTKNADLEILLHTLDEIKMGGAPMSIDIARMVVNSFSKNNNAPLSNKETEVLSLLAEGKSYKTIANIMSISVNTVKFHIKKIYAVLQVTNREHAIEMAKRNKWV